MKSKKVIPWCITGLVALFGLVFLPGVASIFMLLAAVLIAPVDKLKALTRKLLPRKWMKAAVIAALVICFIVTVPTNEQTEPAAPSDSGTQDIAATLQDNTPQDETPAPIVAPDETTEPEETPAPNETPEPEPAPAPEQEPVPNEPAEPTTNEQNTGADILAPAVTPDTETPIEPDGTDYVLNTNSMKFHYPSCGSVSDMSEKNKEYYTGTREELIAQGYSPCGNCTP